ncbi:MAG: amidohydrolase [Sulfobacillus thermosulfidooxidans]|uniref:Amidohydrolase n=1 Tax=Sulfobacillus thermosulfidooxidans TaxID=28034 RepID=A0A2T2WR27_SULTH|nr:MAG: amidohydrolase [Sulfobacillus thermosulfidooxidans]
MGTWQFEGGLKFDRNGSLVMNTRWTITTQDDDQEFSLRNTDLLLPGLADFHVHIHRSTHTLGVSPHALLRSGVLVGGDAGTIGWRDPVPTRKSLPNLKLWISLLPHGLKHHPTIVAFPGLNTSDTQHIEHVIEQHRHDIAGIKIRLGQIDAADDARLLKTGILIAEQVHVPLMVHVSGSFLPPESIVESLRPGDVITHAFHGLRGHFAQSSSAIKSLEDGVKRGIWLDVGQGSRHFSWRTFHRLTAAGIAPHTISTDITQATWHQPPVYDLSYVCSKLYAGGLPLSTIYHGVVTHPTQYLERPLPPHSLVIWRYRSSYTRFPDAEGMVEVGPGYWRPIVVVAHGHIVRNLLKKGVKIR